MRKRFGLVCLLAILCGQSANAQTDKFPLDSLHREVLRTDCAGFEKEWNGFTPDQLDAVVKKEIVPPADEAEMAQARASYALRIDSLRNRSTQDPLTRFRRCILENEIESLDRTKVVMDSLTRDSKARTGAFTSAASTSSPPAAKSTSPAQAGTIASTRGGASSVGFDQGELSGAPTPTGDALGCLRKYGNGNEVFGFVTVNNVNIPMKYFSVENGCSYPIWIAYFKWGMGRDYGDPVPTEVKWYVKGVSSVKVGATGLIDDQGDFRRNFDYVSIACSHKLKETWSEADRVFLLSCE